MALLINFDHQNISLTSFCPFFKVGFGENFLKNDFFLGFELGMFKFYRDFSGIRTRHDTILQFFAAVGGKCKILRLFTVFFFKAFCLKMTPKN